MSGVWIGVDLGQGLGVDPTAGSAVRGGVRGGAVAQAALAVSHCGMSAADVHRAGRAGAGRDAHDDPAAGGPRGGVEDGRDQSEVAAAHGVSWPTVQRAVVAHGLVELVEPEPVGVLGMDETRFGRPRWLPDGTTTVPARTAHAVAAHGSVGNRLFDITGEQACWAGRRPDQRRGRPAGRPLRGFRPRSK